MEGRTLSHYRVLARLGGGGMGVVYKAEDTRLKRLVALKFLPPERTRDSDARDRFVQEAQAASALDHPNICTIHEIDSTDDGQLFIVMAYCVGETLKRRLQRGPLPLTEAIDIAAQIARGLEKAHQAGIVHRDIKPANVMLTEDGLVKIVDFGIAKLIDHTGPTRTGTTLGTVAYMAPEQVKGDAADHRVDVWALGVVLYEMLTGALPFRGEHEFAIVNNIANQQPAPIATARADVPMELERIVQHALAKRPPERYQSAQELSQDLAQCQATLAGHMTVPIAPARRVSGRAAAVLGALALIAVGTPAGWALKRTADMRRAESTLAEAIRLADRDDYVGAFSLAEDLEKTIPGDSRLVSLWGRVSVPRSLTTTPEGADVYVKGYADTNGAWRHLGRTPISEVRLPNSVLRWKIEKAGFNTREYILAGPGLAAGQQVRLDAPSDVPPDMLLIQRPTLNLALTGYDYTRAAPAGDFLIDKYEVTNSEYKKFLDAGGYTKPGFWKQPIVRDGRPVPWAEAVAGFRDRTGRPGPSTWEVGTYPTGQENYPVGGVSWYEAAAYAEFAGKSLPTIYHWLRAAGVGQAAYIMPLSNLDGKGPAAVGAFPGVTREGAFDMAGNVKEWCWNELPPGGARYLLGGAWTDAAHLFFHPDGRSPFDRSHTNGFRLVKYLDTKPLAETLTRAIEAPTRDVGSLEPVPDNVYQAYASMYAYDPSPLDARLESSDGTAEAWLKHKVSFKAAYGEERMSAFLYLPKNSRPPYAAVIFAPGAAAVQTRSADLLQTSLIDFVMISGRALIYPIYKGTYERGTGETSVWPQLTRAFQDWMIQVVNDARRAADYLVTRDDIRPDRLAYYGFSWGSSFGIRAVAVEPRFKAAILVDGGFTQGNTMPPVDSVNFAPRISIPVLMVNGSSDFVYPVETAQKPLFARLGTPPEHKRHVILPGGHGVINQQRSQVVKEVLDWLDRYLGPVER